jgi:hypothetical protein
LQQKTEVTGGDVTGVGGVGMGGIVLFPGFSFKLLMLLFPEMGKMGEEVDFHRKIISLNVHKCCSRSLGTRLEKPQVSNLTCGNFREGAWIAGMFWRHGV